MLGHMANAAMLIVAYFAALLLNFGDFSRFARDEKSMKAGNFLGLPVNFIVFAIITVIVTAGTVQGSARPSWTPWRSSRRSAIPGSSRWAR